MKACMKSRKTLLALVLVAALMLVSVLALAIGADGTVKTELSSVSAIISDGVDIQINGTIAPEDEEKTITVHYTFYGKETSVEVTPNADQTFSVTVPVGPSQMNGEIEVNLYVNEDAVYESPLTASVKEYCVYQLQNSNDEHLKTLVSDVLLYGAAALRYLGDAEEAQALLTLPDGVTLCGSAYATPTVSYASYDGDYFTRISMTLTNRLALTAKPAEGENVCVSGISFLDAFAPQTIEDPNGDVLTYSVADYIARLVASEDMTAEAKDLARAIWCVALSADRFAGHDFSAYTSGEDGMHSRTCARCASVEKESCDYRTSITAPTCEEGGYTTYTCIHCTHSYTGNETQPKGHTYANTWTYSDGYHWRAAICGCEGKFTDYAPHSASTTTVDATCTTPGYTATTCDCGYSVTTDVTPASGHTVNTWVELDNSYEPLDAANCLYTATFEGECEVCGETATKTDPVERHTFFERITTTATCASDGVKSTFCAAEGCQYHTAAYTTAPYGDPAAHVWEKDTDASDDKQTVYTCSVENCTASKREATGNSTTIDKTTNEVTVGDTTISLDGDMQSTLGDGSAEIKSETITGDALSGALAGLDEDEKALVDKVYDFTLTTEEELTDLGGVATIRIPYTLSEGDDPSCIVIWYIKEGKVTPVEAVYEEDAGGNGYVTFTTTHFSYYTVVHLTPEERCELFGGHIAHTTVAPTCDRNGYSVCRRCGQIMPEKITSALGHTFNYTVLEAAGCDTSGVMEMHCAVCDLRQTYTIPALGHHFVEESNTQATCTVSGVRTQICTICGETQTTTTPAVGHSFTNNTTVAPTCTEAGYTETVCVICGESKKTQFTPAKGHEVAEGFRFTVQDHATFCAVCNATLSEEAHVPGDEATDLTPQTCTVCGYVIAPVKDHVHAVAQAFPAQAPSCEESGSIAYYVCDCGAFFANEDLTVVIADPASVMLAPLGHSPSTVPGKAPTCTEEGYTASTVCAVCTAELTAPMTLPPKGHSYITTVTAPTCDEDGVVHYECTACDDASIDDQILPALGHIHQLTTVAPTCSAPGYSIESCARCGEELARYDGADALDHTYSLTPLSNENGHWYTCVRCDATTEVEAHTANRTSPSDVHAVTCLLCNYEIEAALGHTHAAMQSFDAVEATCLSSGRLGYYVCACGAWFFDDECTQLINRHADILVPAKGHTAIVVPQTNPTCTSVGYTAGVHCAACDTWLSGHEELPVSTTHDKAYMDRNDTEHFMHCPVCGEQFDREAHVDADENGVCDVCFYEMKQEEEKTPLYIYKQEVEENSFAYYYLYADGTFISVYGDQDSGIMYYVLDGNLMYLYFDADHKNGCGVAIIEDGILKPYLCPDGGHIYGDDNVCDICGASKSEEEEKKPLYTFEQDAGGIILLYQFWENGTCTITLSIGQTAPTVYWMQDGSFILLYQDKAMTSLTGRMYFTEDGSLAPYSCAEHGKECDWQVSERYEPTCNSEGFIQYMCSFCCSRAYRESLGFGDHTYKDGKCTSCGAIDSALCMHKNAFTTSDEYGHYELCPDCRTKLNFQEHYDGDGDGKCDRCSGTSCMHDGAYMAHNDAQHYMYCKDCGEHFGIEDHYDADANGICDVCFFEMKQEEENIESYRTEALNDMARRWSELCKTYNVSDEHYKLYEELYDLIQSATSVDAIKAYHNEKFADLEKAVMESASGSDEKDHIVSSRLGKENYLVAVGTKVEDFLASMIVGKSIVLEWSKGGTTTLEVTRDMIHLPDFELFETIGEMHYFSISFQYEDGQYSAHFCVTVTHDLSEVKELGSYRQDLSLGGDMTQTIIYTLYDNSYLTMNAFVNGEEQSGIPYGAYTLKDSILSVVMEGVPMLLILDQESGTADFYTPSGDIIGVYTYGTSATLTIYGTYTSAGEYLCVLRQSSGDGQSVDLTIYVTLDLEAGTITSEAIGGTLQIGEDNSLSCKHVYKTQTKQPTCQESGYTTVRCTQCWQQISYEFLPQLDHTDNDGDGICDMCFNSMGSTSDFEDMRKMLLEDMRQQWSELSGKYDVSPWIEQYNKYYGIVKSTMSHNEMEEYHTLFKELCVEIHNKFAGEEQDHIVSSRLEQSSFNVKEGTSVEDFLANAVIGKHLYLEWSQSGTQSFAITRDMIVTPAFTVFESIGSTYELELRFFHESYNGTFYIRVTVTVDMESAKVLGTYLYTMHAAGMSQVITLTLYDNGYLTERVTVNGQEMPDLICLPYTLNGTTLAFGDDMTTAYLTVDPKNGTATNLIPEGEVIGTYTYAGSPVTVFTVYGPYAGAGEYLCVLRQMITDTEGIESTIRITLDLENGTITAAPIGGTLDIFEDNSLGCRHTDKDGNGICDKCRWCWHNGAYMEHNDAQHYMYCKDCGKQFDFEEHYDKDSDSICDVCGYGMGGSTEEFEELERMRAELTGYMKNEWERLCSRYDVSKYEKQYNNLYSRVKEAGAIEKLNGLRDEFESLRMQIENNAGSGGETTEDWVTGHTFADGQEIFITAGSYQDFDTLFDHYFVTRTLTLHFYSSPSQSIEITREMLSADFDLFSVGTGYVNIHVSYELNGKTWSDTFQVSVHIQPNMEGAECLGTFYFPEHLAMFGWSNISLYANGYLILNGSQSYLSYETLFEGSNVYIFKYDGIDVIVSCDFDSMTVEHYKPSGELLGKYTYHEGADLLTFAVYGDYQNGLERLAYLTTTSHDENGNPVHTFSICTIVQLDIKASTLYYNRFGTLHYDASGTLFFPGEEGCDHIFEESNYAWDDGSHWIPCSNGCGEVGYKEPHVLDDSKKCYCGYYEQGESWVYLQSISLNPNSLSATIGMDIDTFLREHVIGKLTVTYHYSDGTSKELFITLDMIRTEGFDASTIGETSVEIVAEGGLHSCTLYIQLMPDMTGATSLGVYTYDEAYTSPFGVQIFELFDNGYMLLSEGNMQMYISYRQDGTTVICELYGVSIYFTIDSTSSTIAPYFPEADVLGSYTYGDEFVLTVYDLKNDKGENVVLYKYLEMESAVATTVCVLDTKAGTLYFPLEEVTFRIVGNELFALCEHGNIEDECEACNKNNPPETEKLCQHGLPQSQCPVCNGADTGDCAHNNTETKRKEPSCTEPGHVSVYCLDCKMPIVDQELDILDHTPDENGMCTACKAVTDAHEHSYSEEWVRTYHVHYHLCVCGAIESSDAHIDNDANGVCDVCSYNMTEELEARRAEVLAEMQESWAKLIAEYTSEHHDLMGIEETYGKYVRYVTAEADYERLSSWLNDFRKDIENWRIQLKNGMYCRHLITETKQKDATCYYEGVITTYCALCGQTVKQEMLPMIDHTPDENGICIACKKPTDMHEHTFAGDWSYDRVAHYHICACGEMDAYISHADGDEDGRCDDCYYDLTALLEVRLEEVLYIMQERWFGLTFLYDVSEHYESMYNKYVDFANEATSVDALEQILNDFYTDINRWEAELKGSTACKHTEDMMGDFMVTIEPTCSTNGMQERTCGGCGTIFSEVVPATGEHVYGDGTTGACVLCGMLMDDPEINLQRSHYITAMEERWVALTTAGFDMTEELHAEYNRLINEMHVAGTAAEMEQIFTEFESLISTFA